MGRPANDLQVAAVVVAWKIMNENARNRAFYYVWRHLHHKRYSLIERND
jgi:hypothetical protein